MREKLVELIKRGGVIIPETAEAVADYLITNNVFVLPEQMKDSWELALPFMARLFVADEAEIDKIKGEFDFNQIERLNEENQIYKNALDLMCKRYFEDCGCEDCPCGENAEFDEIYCKECNGDEYVKNANGKCWANYYLFIAKKELKNEN